MAPLPARLQGTVEDNAILLAMDKDTIPLYSLMVTYRHLRALGKPRYIGFGARANVRASGKTPVTLDTYPGLLSSDCCSSKHDCQLASMAGKAGSLCDKVVTWKLPHSLRHKGQYTLAVTQGKWEVEGVGLLCLGRHLFVSFCAVQRVLTTSRRRHPRPGTGTRHGALPLQHTPWCVKCRHLEV